MLPRPLDNARLRWACYVGAALVLAILVFVPPRYVARVVVLPQAARGSAGGALIDGQTQSFAATFGGARSANDLYLIIARSDRVATQAIDRLGLVGPAPRFATVESAKRAMVEQVDIHSLPGGAIEIEAIAADPADARRLIEAYVGAIGDAITTTDAQAPGRSSLRVIDPTHLDPTPRWNRSALALLAAVAVLAVFVEAYAPATGLFRLGGRESAL